MLGVGRLVLASKQKVKPLMLDFPLPLVYGFIATTVLAVWLGWRAWRCARIFLFISMGWLLITAVLAGQGFFLNTTALPPRFLLAIGPPLVLILYLFSTSAGRTQLANIQQQDLVLIHTVRIPVEIILFGLFQAGTIPELMTFTGRNFDILAGLTAPLIYYFGFVRKRLSIRWIMVWNVLGLGLLLNIVIHAILSAPFPFQQLAFDQPNVAVLHFPFIWLPALVVPLVLFAHLHALLIPSSNSD